MSIQISNQTFIDAAFSNLPDGAFVWATSITGVLDRTTVSNSAWKGNPGAGITLPKLHDKGNNFFNISSLKKSPDGNIGRKSEHFSALHVVVCDDVGTKAVLPENAKPSYLLETSKGNFQAGFFLEPPLSDMAVAKQIFSQMASRGLTDPGAQGPQSRYVRLPIGINTKPENGEGFEHRLKEWNPERKFTVREFCSMLDLDLEDSNPTVSDSEPSRSPKLENRDVLDSDCQVIISKILRIEKAKRVWLGDDTGFQSGSNADQYLLNLIAYQTEDPNLVEIIYSQSKRFDRKSSDGTYKWRDRPEYRKLSIESAFAFVEKNPHGDVNGAKETLEAALKVAKENDDIRGLYSEEVQHAFVILKRGDAGNFDYFRKQAGKAGATLAILDEGIKEAAVLEKAVAHAIAAESAITKFGGGNLVFSMPLGSFWQWKQERGIWARLGSEEPIKQAIHSVLPVAQINAGTVSSILQVLKTKVAKDISFDRPAGDFVVNCANGELHLKDVSFDQGLTEGFWELRPHIRDHYHSSVIPVSYDTDACCPRFHQFLDELFDGDDDAEDKKRTVWQMIAYSLFPTTQLEKFFVLYGPGANNGKSTLLSVVEWIVGKENVSALSLNQLGERFAPANLQGKLINICAEIPMGQTLPDEEIKKLVSGDTITGELKGKNHFEFRPYATLWFATNNLPHSRDVSPATIQKRCILLTFNQSFNGESRDLRLKEKLKEELPGILSYALQLFGGLLVMNREQNHDLLLEEPPSSIEGKAKWLTNSDPVRQFAEDCLFVGSDYFTTSKELYAAWSNWRDETGSKSAITSRQLTDALKRQFDKLIETGESARQNGKRGIKGLALRTD